MGGREETTRRTENNEKDSKDFFYLHKIFRKTKKKNRKSFSGWLIFFKFLLSLSVPFALLQRIVFGFALLSFSFFL